MSVMTNITGRSSLNTRRPRLLLAVASALLLAMPAGAQVSPASRQAPVASAPSVPSSVSVQPSSASESPSTVSSGQVVSGAAAAVLDSLSGIKEGDVFLEKLAASIAGLATMDDSLIVLDVLSGYRNYPDGVKDASSVAFQAITDPGVRAGVLELSAGLYELAGRWADAAIRWEATAKVTGVDSASALVPAAVAWLAAGETFKAATVCAAIRFLGQDVPDSGMCDVVDGWVAAASGDAVAALRHAESAADDESRRVAGAALVLAISLTEGDVRKGYEDRLGALGLKSAEAASLAGTLLLAAGMHGGVSGAADVLADRSPAGTQSQGSGASASAGGVAPVPGLASSPEGSSSASGAGASSGVASTGPGSPASSAEASGGAFWYQLGAFGKAENATSLQRRVRSLGLDAFIRQRASNGLYMVYVPAGPDSGKTVMLLKDAGIEAWRIDSLPQAATP